MPRTGRASGTSIKICSNFPALLKNELKTPGTMQTASKKMREFEATTSGARRCRSHHSQRYGCCWARVCTYAAVDRICVMESAARHLMDLPLDDGIKLLLKGCPKLSKLAVYLRHGSLTDRGMDHIGEFGTNLKWLLLGCAGESDIGLAHLAHEAQLIERIEYRACLFGEAGLAAAVMAMSSLKFLWVQGYRRALTSLTATVFEHRNHSSCWRSTGQTHSSLFHSWASH